MTDDMDFFFPELSDDGQNIPLPPEEMRFTELRAEPVIDEGPLRTRVYVEITPFQQRPYIEVVLSGADGEELASVNVIEPMSRKNVFTLHLRGPDKIKGKCGRCEFRDGPPRACRSRVPAGWFRLAAFH